jgi:hypothetical protein
VLGFLEASGTLGALLAAQWVHWEGTAEAVVPSNLGRARAVRLYEGGFKSSGLLVRQAAAIAETWLGSSAQRIAVTPHWLGRSTDGWLATPSAPAFVSSGEEVLYFLSDPALSAAYFNDMCRVPSYVTVLTSTSAMPRPRQDVGHDELAAWAAAAELMFVSAYDGESFLVLRRHGRS